MKQEHEVCIPGREGVALNLVRELIDRRFEAPRDTSEFLQLYCHCLITLFDPHAMMTGGWDAFRQRASSKPDGASEVTEGQPGIPEGRGDF